MKLFFIIIALFLTCSVFAQYSLSNKDKCQENISMYKEFYKIKLYYSAIFYWKLVYNECPKLSKNIYADGINIYKKLMQKAENQDKLSEYTDTIIHIYDKRKLFFGEAALIDGYKSYYVYKYKSDSNFYKLSYKLSSNYIDSLKSSSDLNILKINFMSIFKLASIDTNIYKLFIDNYFYIDSLLQDKFLSSKKSDNRQKISQTRNLLLEKLSQSNTKRNYYFINSTKKKYEQNISDISNLKNILKILQKCKYLDIDLYYIISEKIFKYEPSSKSAYNIARYYYEKKNYRNALVYYQKAIDLNKSNKYKADFCYEYAVCAKEAGYNIQARNYAQKALDYNLYLGNAWILIAKIYIEVANSMGKTSFEISTIYLLAIDKLKSAKAYDPEVTEQANYLITIYSKYCPSENEAFMNGYKKGDIIKIENWIDENIVLKFR